MTALRAALRELWGLFIDDGSLALGLLLWCAAVALAPPWAGLPAAWRAPLMFLGCLAVLIENVVRCARRRDRRGQPRQP